MSYAYGIKRFSLVDWSQQNGPGLRASTLREFPDLTTLGVASDR